MVLPNFVGIGAQRAATTWAYNCLREHPEIFLPETKEIAFFNRQYGKGLPWYEAQFAGANGQKAIGEITPGYLHSDLAIRRMAADLPEARLFVILREPIQRAYSAYQLLRDHLCGLGFQEALSRSSYLVEESLYADSLERVYRHFERERVRVILYDDLQADPRGVLADLFRFLDVDDAFVPASTGKIYNRIVLPGAQKAVRRIGLGWLVGVVKRTPLGEVLKRRHRSKGGRDWSEIRAACPDEVQARFRDDIAKLEGIIGRRLAHWIA